MEQKNLGFLILWDSPVEIDDSVIEQFQSTADAVKWSFELRKDPGGRSIQWIANHLKMRSQRLSRILNHGDFKLDPAQVPMWDFLVGNTAVNQYVKLTRKRMKKQIAQERTKTLKALKERIAA